MTGPQRKNRRASDEESSNSMIDLRRDFVLHGEEDAKNFKALHTALEGISKSLTDYIHNDEQWKRDDATYKDSNKAALENMKNLSNGWKIFLSACVAVTIIGGAIFTINKIGKL